MPENPGYLNLPLELSARDIGVWRDNRPVSLAGCQRIIIFSGCLPGHRTPRTYIQFQHDNYASTYDLDKSSYSISPPLPEICLS